VEQASGVGFKGVNSIPYEQRNAVHKYIDHTRCRMLLVKCGDLRQSTTRIELPDLLPQLSETD